MISRIKYICLNPLILFSLVTTEVCSGQTQINASEISDLHVVNYDDDTSLVSDLILNNSTNKTVVILLDHFNCKDCVFSLKQALDTLEIVPIYIVGNCHSYSCKKGYLRDFILDKENVYFDYSLEEVEMTDRGETNTQIFSKNHDSS